MHKVCYNCKRFKKEEVKNEAKELVKAQID